MSEHTPRPIPTPVPLRDLHEQYTLAEIRKHMASVRKAFFEGHTPDHPMYVTDFIPGTQIRIHQFSTQCFVDQFLKRRKGKSKPVEQ